MDFGDGAQGTEGREVVFVVWGWHEGETINIHWLLPFCDMLLKKMTCWSMMHSGLLMWL